MGEHRTSADVDDRQLRTFTRALLEDVRALERMIEAGMIEAGVRRIGAEQEFFLVDRGCQPAPVAPAVLLSIDDPAFTTELARFNLEANLPPYPFKGGCLAQLESDLLDMLAKAREGAQARSADVVLAGILPTLQLSDLTLDNMTPVPRYFALNSAMVKLRGGSFEIRIKGIDEFFAVHDNVMLESANTAFQIHFQVAPDEFAGLYNVAQAVTAPVLAAAVNSPLLVERRLWHETRVALFQHSIDSRSAAQLARGQRARVRFGDRWVQRSVLEIFRDDIARFRVMLASDIEEHPMDVLDAGGVPRLRALCLHNGTVYRWNRPCYGVFDGKPHLRIENRALPAGPTVADEVANAAFYFGLLAAVSAEYSDISTVMSFDDAKANFIAAARLGLRAQLTWIGGRHMTATELILQHLLPSARAGLEAHGIAESDIDRYLGVIEARVRGGRTGSQWVLDSLTALGGQGTPHDRMRALTASSIARQKENAPVHTWETAALTEAEDWRHSYRTVGQFMTRELFTVGPDDLVDLAANLMDWEHIRHVPVEDGNGRLLGLLSHRTILRHLAQTVGRAADPVAVKSIMKPNPLTIPPDTPTVEAIGIMRRNKVGCLPVVSGGKLVGVVTERDLIDVAARLLEEHLGGFEES